MGIKINTEVSGWFGMPLQVVEWSNLQGKFFYKWVDKENQRVIIKIDKINRKERMDQSGKCNLRKDAGSNEPKTNQETQTRESLS